MTRLDCLFFAGSGSFAQAENAAALVDQDGHVLQLAPSTNFTYCWGPAFGEAGRPVALAGRQDYNHGLRLTALRDGWVTGGGAVVTGDGGIILDGLAPHAREIEADPGRFELLLRLYGTANRADGRMAALPFPIHSIEEPVFHLLCQGDIAYTHFLIDTLPKLALWDALPEPRPRPLVSADAWKRWRGFLLAATGLPEATFIVHQPRTILRIRQIYVASFPR